MKKVIVICGPTAVGKTKLSLYLATNLKSEIISGDAYQIYKGMDIGTAKPSIEEQKRIKHHLISVINSNEEYSVCDYQKEVREKIEEISDKGMIPIIVGGTGLYIDAVLTDYNFDIPLSSKTDLSKFDNYSNEELHNYLASINKEASANIHMNNRKRVLKAIENTINGKDLSNLGKHDLVYDPLVIFLNDDRKALYERIDTRVDDMITEGLLVEVKKLFDNNMFSKTSSQAIGYKELIPYFNGEISLDEAIDNIKKATRHYAKRQLTWFRNKFYTHELLINSNDYDKTLNEALELVNTFLNN